MQATPVFVGLLLVLTCIWQFTDAKKCQHGFVKYNKNCYWFSPKKMVASWAEAQVYCNVMNSYLAIITSAHENNFIRGHLFRKAQSSIYWIGANDLQAEGHFQWLSAKSRTAVKYTKWSAGQPDNNGGAENCVELRRRFGFHWNDWGCYHGAGFICEQF
ncbi:perlucin-like [Gigantopelta aegis]|uniref:perlucin-like n=1 Tax=Gigantopelta aegis TaxID=1735272 RepID=UPI001B88774E|nr:perlucin-like [Gigantopelta aegis]